MLKSNLLQQAQTHAERGRFPEMLSICQQLVNNDNNNDASILLSVGALLLNFGFTTQAKSAFERAHCLAPTDLRATINLANVYRDTCQHHLSQQLYGQLLKQLPDYPVVRRNALVSLEYDPHVLDSERLAQAKNWGTWAVMRAGGPFSRPPLPALGLRPLRVGYVSADFCQHTVGLFVKDVLKAHNPARVQAFAYSAGNVNDWVTHEVRAACQFRDVAALDDASLVQRIRQDGIDVLVDLSGHTAGSRLSVFAHRPAPVQVSWLGYFATTGLACMDAVLLDDAHAPPSTETQFVEPLLRLPGGRWCYQPVPWAPATVAPPPCDTKGYITFGCFNHTAKLNEGVFDVWAKILVGVPRARLVLKWRTFNDEIFCQTIHAAFAQRGITPERVELRGPSFHADLLHEYADIDIALDPFPFTGGLTSCEALWMGVPVVTWPQIRVVSRQTYALLCAIGLPEWAATSADGYVRIAIEMAHNPQKLADLRYGLRQKMQASPLMDVQGFTQQLERSLIARSRSE